MECVERNEIIQKKMPGYTDLLARFPEESNDPILHIDNGGILLYINPAAKSLLNKWDPCVGNTLPEEFLRSLNKCLETTACTKTGVEVKVEDRRVVFTPVQIDDSNFLFLYGHDVTWWRHYEDHLKLLADVFENVGDSIIITDAHGLIETVNPAFTVINGFTLEEVIGKTPRFLRSNRHGSEFYKWMWNEIVKNGIWKGKIWNRRKNGEIYPALLSISAIKDNNGKTTHYCSICHDITGRKVDMERLQFDAYHDALTGLPTMQLFYDRLDRAFIRARRKKTMIGIIVVDLDGFRHFNDQFGYRTGDLLLQHVARRLRGACQDNDTLARPGSDEFIVIVSGDKQNVDSIAARADRIMKSLSVPMNISGNTIHVKSSIGIAVYPEDATDMHTLLEHSQEAVHTAKKKGGHRYVLYQ